jgi:Fe2+ transport system protein FeoA
MQPPQTLDRIARGLRVRVTGIRGDDPIARRLDDLGLRPGVVVEVLRRAPLGDPTVFELHGYQLCLRRSESERVEVEPVQAVAAGEAR